VKFFPVRICSNLFILVLKSYACENIHFLSCSTVSELNWVVLSVVLGAAVIVGGESVCALCSIFFVASNGSWCLLLTGLRRPSSGALFSNAHTHTHTVSLVDTHKCTKMWEVSYSHDGCIIVVVVVRCFFQNGRNAGEQQQIKLQSQIKFAKKKEKSLCENWRQKEWVIVFMLA